MSLEVFVPLAFVATADQIWPGHSAIARLGASFWSLAVAAMPLWSRSRVRLGDLARRTTPNANAKDTARDAPQFRPEQLSIYGIYELQVLEEVLRKARQPGGREAVAAVAARIRTKIDWDPLQQGKLGDEEFLQAFYAEQASTPRATAVVRQAPGTPQAVTGSRRRASPALRPRRSGRVEATAASRTPA